MIALIAAVDRNWGIGYNGDLLARIPEDLKHFKALTMNHNVIMGRKTWDSLLVHPLPGRQSIVITSQKSDRDDLAFYIDLEPAINWLKTTQRDLFVIGGSSIYKALLPYCDYAYITKIDHAYENVDAYCPNLDKDTEWKVVSAEVLKTESFEYPC
jgi:dihydrofolate reductase